MGLFGPNWTWDEFEKKEAIMSDLRKENDRVLAELQYMNDLNSSGTGKVIYGPGMGTLLLGFLGVIFGIGFIACIPILLSQLVLLDEGDPIAVEILTWLISAGSTWLIGIKKIENAKDYKDNFKMLFKYNLIIVMIAMIVVDVVFFGALSTSTKAMQFIFGIILSIFFMAIWSGLVAALGIIIVPVIKPFIKFVTLRIRLINKKKVISNSKLYKKIITNISNGANDIIDIKINSKGLLINRDNKDFSIIFASEGFSNLDDTGVYGLGELIKKEFRIFKLKKCNDGIILNNKDYLMQQKKNEKNNKAKEKNDKKKEKQDLKKSKNLRKEKIKNGEDW